MFNLSPLTHRGLESTTKVPMQISLRAIRDVNTRVRRLRYISQLALILGRKGLSGSLLLDRLLRWSKANEDSLRAYDEKMRGQITSTRKNSAGVRYLDFAVDLGLVTKTTDLYRCTRLGRVAKEITAKRPPFLNPFELDDAEKLLFLYLLIERDADILLTIMWLLYEEKIDRLVSLRRAFKQRYRHRIQQKMQSVADERVRRLLLDRRREIERWGERGSPERYAEHIIPPRLHWLYDLGLMAVEEFKRNVFRLSEAGTEFYLSLPRLPNTNVADVPSNWIRECSIQKAGKALFQNKGFRFLRENGGFGDIIKKHLSEAFRAFRTTPVPKVSLYPTLLFVSLRLATCERVLSNISDLEEWISTCGTPYEIRLSARENEAYIILK